MELMMTKESGNRQTVTEPAISAKIFSGSDPDRTEKELNEWLKKQRVRVHHIGQSQCERNGNLLFVVSLFYTCLANQN